MAGHLGSCRRDIRRGGGWIGVGCVRGALGVEVVHPTPLTGEVGFICVCFIHPCPYLYRWFMSGDAAAHSGLHGHGARQHSPEDSQTDGCCCASNACGRGQVCVKLHAKQYGVGTCCCRLQSTSSRTQSRTDLPFRPVLSLPPVPSSPSPPLPIPAKSRFPPFPFPSPSLYTSPMLLLRSSYSFSHACLPFPLSSSSPCPQHPVRRPVRRRRRVGAPHLRHPIHLWRPRSPPVPALVAPVHVCPVVCSRRPAPCRGW